MFVDTAASIAESILTAPIQGAGRAVRIPLAAKNLSKARLSMDIIWLSGEKERDI